MSKKSRLKFTKEEKKAEKEKAQTKKFERKVTETEGKSEKYGQKRDEYHEKQPTRKVRKKERYFDEGKGKPQTRLRFEKETIPINEAKWNNPKPKTVGEKAMHISKKSNKMMQTAAVNKLHRKIYEVEQENVGTQAVHRAELVGESAYRGGKKVTRSAYRFVRNTPYRRSAKFEAKSIKTRAKLEYQKALRDNPKMRSNPVSRLWQKHSIKKQYADALKTAKKSGKTAKRSAGVVKRVSQTVTKIVRGNPVFLIKAALLLLIIFMIMALFSMCATLFSGGTGFVGGTSYTSEDADIIAAENAYTQFENGLRTQINSIENDYPNYDEYRYTLDEIGHDPFELASYLTAKYHTYTLADVQEELQSLYGQQYSLTVTEEIEVRYRTETRTGHYTDSEGNSHSYSYTVEVAYNYYILNVTLKNKAISGLTAANLNAEQLEMYAVYMTTQGNKPYLFEGNIYVNHGEYTGYTIPGDALTDASFAALIAEAEKYLGYPYVWGGSSPSTSFDCSGFVCWVLNQSGVASVGRTTATGLLNMCTVVSANEAKPGDLIFFQGTYDTIGASHVGIYVGNGMMLHCGNPIQYTSIETTYWQNHFLAFGRINN